jgi:hypothetical protein
MLASVGEVTHVVRSCVEILVAICRASHLVVVDVPDLNKFNLKVSSVVYVGGIDPNAERRGAVKPSRPKTQNKDNNCDE